MTQRFSTYGGLIRRGFKMLSGSSYYHVPQPLGKHYHPNQLHGYYNDLAHKAFWHGEYDPDGMPLNRDDRGEGVIIPTTVIQKGLGHWEQWLARGDFHHLKQAQHIADWLVAHQDARGGWSPWFMLRFPQDYLVPYSAMTQGEAVSLLMRLYHRTGQATYRDSAQRALDLMLLGVENGGTARHWGNGEQIILDEFPQKPMSIVLNGWIFALYGLVDFVLVDSSPSYTVALERTVLTLVTRLEGYDMGYWSRYDSRGTIASPFYHDLHLAQLEALALTFPEHATTFNAVHHTWARHRQNPLKRARAVGMKTLQKLQRPPRFVNQ
ncbi:MAG: D-glucuronyl C5-epimerase family protein [Phototrophicaceae bacterium]